MDFGRYGTVQRMDTLARPALETLVAVQPEVRYWFCDHFSGHFVGAHIHGGQYNIGGFDGKINFLGTDARKLKDTRYQGWFVGAGIAYGYTWILGRHWNLEAEIGLGYSYTRYDRFQCAGCGRKLETDKTTPLRKVADESGNQPCLCILIVCKMKR